MKSLQIKNILIPTDFSETGDLAVEHAVFMARLCEAKLHLLHLVEFSESSLGIYDPAFAVPVFSDVKKIADKKLNDLADSLRKRHGITVKTICARGKVFVEIVNAVKKNSIDIVIMGTHGASGFNEYFIGSNAHKTVSTCPCPVITVQTHSKKLGFKTIVLPIGDNFNSRQKVNATVSLAKKYGSKIHVLGLIERKADINLKTFKVKLESVEKVIKKAGLEYVTKMVLDNNLSNAALKYSKRVKADLIVVLAGEESHLGGLLFGAFTKDIVNHSKFPVMSIRPVKVGVHDFKYMPGFR